MSNYLAEHLIDRSRRMSRRDVVLDASPGLYALFLKSGSSLPDLPVPDNVLVYLGKADGAGGLKTRCHFNGGTRNHSPRKSLAVILETALRLVAKPIVNSDGSYKTWALEKASELALDEWMHAHLDVAYVTASGAASHEKIFIRRFAPILNLTDCPQSEVHLYITKLRRNMDERMRSAVR